MRIFKSVLACVFLSGISAAVAAEGEGRAWLGVTLSPVPMATAKQLKLDGVGIMVTNVAENSPAAEAGLEQFDVIVELNGKEVADEFEQFAARVKELGVGGKAELMVIRGGERVKAVVELAEMPEPDQIEYRFEHHEPQVTEWADDLVGRILERGPGGRWTIRDLGELEELGDVLEDLKELKELKPPAAVPGPGESFEVRIEADDNHSREARVTHDGETCEVKIDKEGKITVRHISQEGDLQRITERSYESEEQLKEADEQAYDIYKQLTGDKDQVIIVKPGGPDSPRLKLELRKEVKKALEDARRQMKEAQEKMQQAEKEASEQMRKWRFHVAPEAWKGWPAPPAPPGFAMPPDQPATSFLVDDAGTIRVTTRKGDAELIREFKNADDLAKREPELFEKFKELGEAQ